MSILEFLEKFYGIKFRWYHKLIYRVCGCGRRMTYGFAGVFTDSESVKACR